MFALKQQDREWLRAFCERWEITELALFGSALTDKFRADSDIDILVTFASDAVWSLLHHVEMQEEIHAYFGRPVDLVSRHALERSANPLRKQNILTSAEVVYAA